MPLVRIAVISDDRLYAEGLVRILASEVCFIPVAYSSAADVPAPENEGHPHVALVDSRQADAAESCMSLATAEGAAVIFMAAPDDDKWASVALDAGARGIVTKTMGADDLIRAVQSVRAGQIWARRRVMAARIDYLAGITAVKKQPAPLHIVDSRLSSRETEVFRHAAAGLPNKELAKRLDISEATVKAHLTHIFQKLGVHGRAALAAAYHGVLGERVR